MSISTLRTDTTEHRDELTREVAGQPASPIRIVHLGLGAFHRAHQAWYTDVVDVDREWGIAAFTGRTSKAADELTPQDGLYTLIERAETGDSARIISSITEAIDGSDVSRMIELIAAPTTAIITTTITEAGYRLLPDGSPDLSDPVVEADVAKLTANEHPSSPLARILAGLRERRTSGVGPLAFVPCDNMPDNGRLVERGLRDLAAQVDAGLAAWIAQNVSFVSTSIDRITPKTTEEDLSTAAALTGWRDTAPVVTEPFRDWVLSGGFPAGRPAWENAGARFVADITPFEHRKLWLLNGSHTLLAYAGRLAGHKTVAEAIADPTCRAWVNEFWDEAVRHLPEGLDLESYRIALLSRFDNSRIAHQLAQIGQDGITKLRVRILPTLFAEREAGRSGLGSMRAIAAWVTLQRRGAELPDSKRSLVDAVLGKDGDVVASLLDLIDPRLTADAQLLAALRTEIATAR